MILTDSFGFRGVEVKGGGLICTLVDVNATTPGFFVLPQPNALKCYVVNPAQITQPSTQAPNHPALISEDALIGMVGEEVSVGDPSLLCVPAVIGP
jgi:hypothetical protein